MSGEAAQSSDAFVLVLYLGVWRCPHVEMFKYLAGSLYFQPTL